MDRISEVIGWDQIGDVRFNREKGRYGFEDSLDRIRASVDAGVPVLCYGRNLDMSLIFGYQIIGEGLIIKDYHNSPSEDFILPASKIGPMLVILKPGQGTPVPDKIWLEKTLEFAIENYENGDDGEDGRGKYYLGRAALNLWIEDLETWSEFEPRKQQEMFQPHWWVFNCLFDARSAGEKYLRLELEKMGSDPYGITQDLQVLIELVGKENKILVSAFKNRNAFLGPWSKKGIEDWSDDVRAREISILKRVYLVEQAINKKMREIHQKLQ